ncbi:MAG TPA: sulfatase-like hydrolase/transferase, partial [Myxococcota bacterium]|nr:sulfatase-like hydrolase/transferase [Myxococcota bacterium]
MLLALLSAALAAPPNVLLVVVDALRADRVFGPDAENTTPNLQRFARRSVVFPHTISSGAWTVPAMASLFTSLDPQVHRTLRYNPQERLPDDSLPGQLPTLAETFFGGGYQTSALL